MGKPIWVKLAKRLALATLLAGCSSSGASTVPAAGGRAGVSNGGSAGNSAAGGGVSSTAGASGSSTELPAQTAGAGDDCIGTLEEVSNALGIACPVGVCAATAWAETCNSLPVSVLNATGSDCAGIPKPNVTNYVLRSLTMNLSATRGKACRYDVGSTRRMSGDGPPLVGAEAWSETNEFCNGTSKRITAGKRAIDCSESPPRIMCEGGVAGSGMPPDNCFDSFGSFCAPCCPAVPPDCSGKPDDYPGYGCIPANDDYARCSCLNETWHCADHT